MFPQREILTTAQMRLAIGDDAWNAIPDAPGRRAEAAPIGLTKPKARITGPKKAEAIARRRRLASCWPLPPKLAGHFTTCELSALRVIADDMKRHGSCAMFIDKIAAIAGTCRTIVKSALRKARALRLLTLEERRRRGQRSLTNVVRFLCMTWKHWILGKPTGVRNLTTTDKQFETNGSIGFVERLKGIMPAPPALKFET